MAQRDGGRTISKPGLPEGAVEIAARRRRTSAVFLREDGLIQHIISGPMHYEKDGAWEEIDNRWQPAEAPWDYQMLAADYQARLLKRLDAGQILWLEKSGHYLTYQPMGILWTNDEGMIDQIAMPAAVDGVVSNSGETGLCQQGRIDWESGYGAGLDFAYIPSTHFFRKLLTVGSLAALGTPEQYILDGGNPVLALEFIFDSDLDLYVDGELWDRSSRKQTASRIEFRDGETVHWCWRMPNAIDANGGQQPGTIEVRKVGNSLYVSARLPWSWLETAAYPVEIDPDTYYGETTDAYLYGSNANYNTARATCTSYLAAETTLGVGQHGPSTFLTRRTVVEFDTSGIAAAVAQANLYLTATADNSTTDFDTEVMKFAWASPLAAGNQEANYDGALVADKDVTWRSSNGIAINTSYGSPNLATAWIEVDGITQYALVSDRDIAATEPSDDEYLWLASQSHATEARRPYLSIIEAAAGQPTMRRWGGVPGMPLTGRVGW